MNKWLILLMFVSITCCTKKPAEFDKLKIEVISSGPVPISTFPSIPSEDNVVIYQRGNAGILTAYYRKTLPCPLQMINSVSAVKVTADVIQLCFEPIESPSPKAAPLSNCPYNLAIKYELYGIPKSIEPKFEVIESCPE